MDRGSSGEDSSEGEQLELLRRRVRFFTAVIFWLLAAMTAAVSAGMLLWPGDRPPELALAYVLNIGGLAGIALAWWFTRTRALGRRTLLALDAAVMIGAGAAFGAGNAFTTSFGEELAMSFSFAMLLVLSRVSIIPSTARRTAWLSAICLVLVSAGNVVAVTRVHMLQIGLPLYILGGVTLIAITTAVAALASGVIYGLRREVRDAQRLGQYTLEEKLGEGGMGAVYKARHAMLRRPTAIKLLPPDKIGADSVARFEREVQLTSTLTHPNTVAIFDYGRSADGVFYYAMEYLDGVDLERLVGERGALPAARAIHLLVQVCDALDEAHQRGLVHRDVKPANIIVCRRGSTPDVVKVVDFGLVKELEAATGATAANALAGTPAYMAPEAITAPGTVGPASDLYAVGAVAYFLVTGTRVFDGATVMEVCGHHVHSAPQPPSKRLAGVPADLEQLILECLAKDPAQRPRSARTLRVGLTQLADAGKWSEDDSLAWWREHEARRRAPPDAAAAALPELAKTLIAVDVRGRRP